METAGNTVREIVPLGMVTATAAVTVIGPATAIATARLAGNHNEVMASR